MSKQTAVEWLQEEITNRQNGNGDSKSMNEIFDQALTMHKEQIVDAHIEGQRVFDNYEHTQWTTDQAEQFYNETYGGNNE
jgi:hypothetical protein